MFVGTQRVASASPAYVIGRTHRSAPYGNNGNGNVNVETGASCPKQTNSHGFI